MRPEIGEIATTLPIQHVCYNRIGVHIDKFTMSEKHCQPERLMLLLTLRMQHLLDLTERFICAHKIKELRIPTISTMNLVVHLGGSYKFRNTTIGRTKMSKTILMVVGNAINEPTVCEAISVLLLQ